MVCLCHLIPVNSRLNGQLFRKRFVNLVHVCCSVICKGFFSLFSMTSIACNINDEYVILYALNIIIIIMSRFHTMLGALLKTKRCFI